MPEYEFPKFADPARNVAVNRKLYEMLTPWLKAEAERGGAINARVRNTSVRDRRGKLRVVPEQSGDHCGRKGMLPVWRPGGVRLVSDTRGYLWRQWRDGTLEPTGHLHVPGLEPLPHVRARCAGCQVGG